jgi:hypothetical protein
VVVSWFKNSFQWVDESTIIDPKKTGYDTRGSGALVAGELQLARGQIEAEHRNVI